MSGQTSYSYASQSGIAGGIVDLSNKVIDSRVYEEMDMDITLKFGMGVVVGSSPATNVNAPSEDSKLSQFEGVLVNGHTTQQDLDGVLSIADGSSVGVMRAGRIWARVDSEASISYGDSLYLITKGDLAGYFTNVAEDSVKMNGRFLTQGNTVGLHAVELFSSV